MANPLEIGSVSPPAPNPDAGNALQQGAPAQQQGQPQQPVAPPNHQEVVSALRHFDGIKEELSTLLKNPSLGRSSIKSQIIDSVSNLVSKRLMAPAVAVMELSKVPDDPIQQRKMLEQQLTQTIQAERGILAHHAVGYAGQPAQPTPSADSHMQDIAGLHANYQK